MPNNNVIQNNANAGVLPPDPLWAQTLLLFKAGKGLIDLTAKSTFNKASIPLTNTRQKFSAVSAEYDGTASKAFISDAGKGASVSDTGWTMEGWIYVPSSGNGTNRAILANETNAGAGAFTIFINSNNKLVLGTNIDRNTSASVFPTDQWAHFAVDKNAANTSNIWINGIADTFGSGGFGGNFSGAVGVAIGSRLGVNIPFKGSIDSIRVTQAIRYSDNFTPGEFSDH